MEGRKGWRGRVLTRKPEGLAWQGCERSLALAHLSAEEGKLYKTPFIQGGCKIIRKAVSNCFCVFVQNMNTDF